MNKKSKKRKESLLLLVLFLLVGISFSYVAGTYAKYVASFDNEGTATVAKWAFDEDNSETDLTLSLDGTYDAKSLVSGKIAPGTSGKFSIDLTNENSEVGVEYSISLKSVGDTVPTNLKFYTDNTYSTQLTTSSTPITGKIAARATTGATATIYWKWDYETGTVTNGIAAGDATDTTDGEAASNFTVTLTVTGKQINPTATWN